MICLTVIFIKISLWDLNSFSHHGIIEMKIKKLQPALVYEHISARYLKVIIFIIRN